QDDDFIHAAAGSYNDLFERETRIQLNGLFWLPCRPVFERRGDRAQWRYASAGRRSPIDVVLPSDPGISHRCSPMPFGRTPRWLIICLASPPCGRRDTTMARQPPCHQSWRRLRENSGYFARNPWTAATRGKYFPRRPRE